MNKHISSDNPVQKKEEDRFQRYHFSRRIAETIVTRQSEDCIVIGIYGMWGEGKTSVVNFIESDLKQHQDVIIVKYNPWRYKDEDDLLKQFFQKLAGALNANLQNSKERLGEIFKKYGKLLSFDLPIVGNLGDTARATGEVLTDTDLESLKHRLEEIIKENGKKLVILIDDIDRLEKAEIHAIFRLVKLTADFGNTTYVLSFDEKMVASAIGDRFGDAGQLAGLNFLEKIIQVPLTIPKAQPEALREFCIDLLNRCLTENTIDITEDDGQRYLRHFNNCFLSNLTTPRLAVRYVNSLAFTIPLLKGEVNICDLLLIEGIKIFFPTHYEFIKNNSSFFVETYADSNIFNRKQERVKTLKNYLEQLSSGLTDAQKRGIEDLLEDLFPALQEAFHNIIQSDQSLTDLFRRKRIASAKYFNRYFTFAVIKGEVSDVAFQNFVNLIDTSDEQTIIKGIKLLADDSSPTNLIHKFRVSATQYPWETAVKLSRTLMKCSDLFPDPAQYYFSFLKDTPQTQLAIFVYDLLKHHKNRDEGFVQAKILMEECQTAEFAFELLHWMKFGMNDGNGIFEQEQYDVLEGILLSKALNDAGKVPLFEKFPEKSIRFYIIWSKINKHELIDNIDIFLKADAQAIVRLLRGFTPTMRSSAYKMPYLSNFNEGSYKTIIDCFGRELIVQYLSKAYSNEEVKTLVINWDEHHGEFQNDLNIVKQFWFWDAKANTDLE